MNKSLSYVNLSLELHVVSPFWLGSDTSDTFSLYFAQPSYELLERPALRMHILWCRTDICSCKLSAKVSLMLDNPFPVLSLCKLNHISRKVKSSPVFWGCLFSNNITTLCRRLLINVFFATLWYGGTTLQLEDNYITTSSRRRVSTGMGVLEQESHLSYIKKAIKKILQTTDPFHF